MRYVIIPPSSDSYLAHHGVQGMHWGVRRYQPYPDGSFKIGSAHEAISKHRAANADKRAKKRKEAKAAIERADKQINRRTIDKDISEAQQNINESQKRQSERTRTKLYKESKTLSDAELRERINRMQMEKQYRDLMRQDTEAGMTEVEYQLNKFGKQVFDKTKEQSSQKLAKKVTGKL